MNIPEQPTPFYVYDIDLLRKTLAALTDANTEGYVLHYALKANTDPRLLEIIKDSGAGADCVSGGEIQRALDVGFDPSRITFAGVGKTDDEIRLAVEGGIGYINLESLEEIEVVGGIAKELQKNISVCIRVNPNIDAHTHEHITTGLEGDKFGIVVADLEKAHHVIEQSGSLTFAGYHFHVGSQIDDMSVFELLAKKAKELVTHATEKGRRISILNLGGGLAVDYTNPKENPIPNFSGYFETIAKYFPKQDGIEVHFEFGRAIVAQCGNLVTKVLYNKIAGGKNVVIVDAGMTELMRPALYDAYHDIENVTSTGPKQKYTIVGPICESTDVFGEGRELNETKRGDILVIRSAGAYGQTMSSEYNLRQKVKAYYIGE